MERSRLHGVVLPNGGYNLAEIIHAGGMFLGFGPGVLGFFRTLRRYAFQPFTILLCGTVTMFDINASKRRNASLPSIISVGRSGASLFFTPSV